MKGCREDEGPICSRSMTSRSGQKIRGSGLCSVSGRLPEEWAAEGWAALPGASSLEEFKEGLTPHRPGSHARDAGGAWF